MAIQEQLIAWLKSLAPGGAWRERESQTRVASATGIPQPTVSKIFAGKHRADVPLSTLASIRDRYLPGEPLWKLVKEIEDNSPQRPSTEADAERVIRQVWLRWFREDPDRAMRVLQNMIAQDELGITDLVSQIVHLVIDSPNPRDRDFEIAKLLHAYEPRTTARVKRALERYRDQYPPHDPPIVS